MAKLIDKIKFNEIEFLMFVLDELADELSKDGKDVIKLTLGKAQEPLHPRIVSAWVGMPSKMRIKEILCIQKVCQSCAKRLLNGIRV